MKVKICGITHPEDACMARQHGADFIGVIFARQSKRHVELPLAKKIIAAASQAGAVPIGVFVEQTAEEIVEICQEVGLTTAQLHGDVSRQTLAELQTHLSLIYAIPVERNGIIKQMPELPVSVIPLFDCLQGGSGLSFDWNNFTPPSNSQWMLAGGLTPTNVGNAIRLLKPSGVDVAGGVEYQNSTRKDPELVKAFIQAVHTGSSLIKREP